MALVSKCLENGAEMPQSVLMPKCFVGFVAVVSGNRYYSQLTAFYMP